MFRKFIIYVPIVGGVVLGVSVLMSQIGSLQVVNEFLDPTATVKAATDADNGADRLRPRCSTSWARSRSRSAWSWSR